MNKKTNRTILAAWGVSIGGKERASEKLSGRLTLLFALAVGALSSPSFAAVYDPAALTKLTAKIADAHGRGLSPVVVFDIDDTLTNSNVRKVAILREFANQADIRSEYPREASRIATIGAADIRWTITESLQDFGVTDPDLQKLAEAYWLPRFFGPGYCALDTEIAGAARFVSEVLKAGATVIYLSGRSEATMSNCTRESFKTLGIKTGTRAVLMLKPDPAVPDLQYKRNAFAEIGKRGEVVAAFENEPANLNAYRDAFKNAKRFLIDSIHSPDPTRPLDDTVWLANFLH